MEMQNERLKEMSQHVCSALDGVVILLVIILLVVHLRLVFVKKRASDPIILKDTVLQTETKSGMGHDVFPYWMQCRPVQTLSRLPCAQSKLYLRSRIYSTDTHPPRPPVS
jgi:hypothetical protein